MNKVLKKLRWKRHPDFKDYMMTAKVADLLNEAANEDIAEAYNIGRAEAIDDCIRKIDSEIVRFSTPKSPLNMAMVFYLKDLKKELEALKKAEGKK